MPSTTNSSPTTVPSMLTCPLWWAAGWSNLLSSSTWKTVNIFLYLVSLHLLFNLSRSFSTRQTQPCSQSAIPMMYPLSNLYHKEHTSKLLLGSFLKSQNPYYGLSTSNMAGPNRNLQLFLTLCAPENLASAYHRTFALAVPLLECHLGPHVPFF